ncbi:Cwf15/Cwc15 cell cycle control family protein [Theileria parva strain Muguga]|uniref:Cwf15/Cwc15 cell cycle control family protein n=1 Tax=Theileria parva strain Muguga TaxID=333668 RepID=UPI001C618BE2|nr:Cwf15/Cwc15 cell cycle control family protein [Theileria parva strain Muguga]EAN31322.2 Cwf15/Cwc15 cell cycle control family protein [Theileria parva strain Muguga]
MSTAHRPTWNNSTGVGLEESGLTASVSSKDLPSHTELKRRSTCSPGSSETGETKKLPETKKLLREKLEETENAHKTKNVIEDQVGVTKDFLTLEDVSHLLNLGINSFNHDGDHSTKVGKENREDEESALLRELAKIRKEREEIKQREMEEELNSEEARGKLLNKNPLMDPSNHPRPWDEDVVFRNPQTQSQQPPSFLNDAVRTDFHRRFLHKYIQ